MNVHAVRTIYKFEMARAWRTLLHSIVSPVISTSLYFVVFGAAIGSRINQVEGVSYGAFIVPGLIHAHAADSERIQRLLRHLLPPVFRHDLRDPVGDGLLFRDRIGLCRAAATKSVILGLGIPATASLFVEVRIDHPVWMVLFLFFTAATFSLLGFIIGIWADGFRSCSWYRYRDHTLPSWAARSIPLRCCRRSGKR